MHVGMLRAFRCCKATNVRTTKPAGSAPGRTLLHSVRVKCTMQPAPPAAGEHKHTNRLAQEQSPYLLQHAHNPVDWYPWCEEAFEAARSQNKPIFLSVGYATCHWCHVMERESFESEDTAAIMNQHFINVKVDREERPDVDRVYMTFVQATTGGGGWPMSVWLTPELKPIYGGTYYPGKDQFGMPSFITVLKRVAQLWEGRQSDLEEQASTVMEQLEDFTTSSPPDASSGGATAASAASVADPQKLLAAITSCTKYLAKNFDSKLGGFGGAPKFPRPSEINHLLRAATQAAVAEAMTTASSGSHSKSSPSSQLLLGMCLFSLQAMAAGGMYDQLGGGFHRYSVDQFWHVPHFEKMLYDNPQLAVTYLDAFKITLAAQRRKAAALDTADSSSNKVLGLAVEDGPLAEPRVYAQVVRGVLDYLRRDMTHPEGGLYSAEDADSLDTSTGSKAEGAFYVWTAQEVEEVLGSERSAAFNEVYGVQAEGNCDLSTLSDPHKEFVGKNVLMQFKRIKEPSGGHSSSSSSSSEAQQQQLLGECRRLLFDRRAQRPRPALDDKIVTAWNGQGISAFAQASRALPAEDPSVGPCFPVEGCPADVYLKCAVRIASFLKHHVWDESTGRLKRAYCKAPSAVDGFSDDYALLIAGLLDLYEAGGGLGWLQWAQQLQQTMDQLFWDGAGGYFQSSGSDPSIKLRLKEDYDGAEPAASSIAAANLIRLAGLLPHAASPVVPADSSSGSSSGNHASVTYQQRADAVLGAFLPRLEKAGMAMPQMCAAAWLRSRVPLRQVIISGKADSPGCQELLNAVHASWSPDKIILLIDPADPESVQFWLEANPAAWAMVEAHHSKTAAAAGAGPGEAAAAIAAAAATSDVAAAAGADGGYQPTAFVCQNFTCQAPTASAQKVYELLTAAGTGAGGWGPVKLTPVKLL